MIRFKRADHFHICVPPERLEEAKEFYSGLIGLQPEYRPDVFGSPGYWFRIADTGLHVGVEAPLPPSIRHTAFEVEDLAAARKHLEQSGITILEEPPIPGRQRFAFLDPFGNRMELLVYV